MRQQFPVLTKEDMRHYVGGNGNSYFGGDWFYHGFGGYDPDGNFHWYSGYTQEELDNWEGYWPGGWVYGLGYVAPDTDIYGKYPGGNNSYDPWGNGYPYWPGSNGYPGLENYYPGIYGYYGTRIYSYEEYMNWKGSWPGGWVVGLGYVSPEVVINGHYTGSGNSSGGNNSSSGNSSITSGNNDGINNNNNLTTITDVLSPMDFSGYQTTDSKGCQRRCKEMLKAADVEMSGENIIVVENSDGEAGKASADAQKGIDAINKALNSGKPIIVGVDYKKANYNDGITDHFIVIVGRTVTTDNNGNQVIQYHYYDPAATGQDVGTSDNNVLTLKDGKLIGIYRKGSKYEQKYTVSSVRPNKQ